MIVSKHSNNTSPLCYLLDGRLVCYHHGRIILLQNGDKVSSYPFPVSGKEKILGWNRSATRLSRFGIRAAIALDNKNIVLSQGNMLYEMDITNGNLSKGWFCGEGIRPLVLTEVKGIDGFVNGLYFGGYVHNFDKEPVNIYRRIDADNWEIIYTFSKSTINHIHNIIPDPYRQCVWIFTGDFGESAAIWKATDGFNKMERVVCGDQKWRGCVAFATPEGVLYATDAPFVKNFIYLLKEDKEVAVLGELAGSSIYGCQWKDKYVFSTVVEPDGRNETVLGLLLGWKRGAGIEDNCAHIYYGTIKDGFIELYKEKKDKWPFIFQFGAFRFPSGLNTGDTLYFQPVATQKNDMRLLAIKE